MLSIKGISKSYGDRKIIKDLCENVKSGEIVALVGPNGAGKTTLLRMIAGLILPDKGEIFINNLSSSNNNKNIFFMQDATILYPYLSGYDHIKFVSNVRGTNFEYIKKVIKEFGIESYVYKKVSKYSLGMKQHLLLALAVLSQPDVLLLDEPLNGLDQKGIKLFRRQISKLKENGTAILFSSHLLSEIDKIADRLIFIDEGSIIDNKLNDLNKSETRYIINVSDKAITKQLAINHNYIINDWKHDSLIVNIDTSNDLNQFIRILIHSDITINEISKQINNVEIEYSELYGENL